jgi:hypothetical protein
MAASENPEKLTAREILDQLQAKYRSFEMDAGKHEKVQTGLAGIFGKWLRSTTPAEPEPLYAEFLSTVQTLVTQLAEALRDVSAGERDESIQVAAKLMLAAKPMDSKTQAEWYMVAAEHSFCVLIPLLTPGMLQSIRDAYLKSTPKRMMFPRQLDLLKQMNQGIH